LAALRGSGRAGSLVIVGKDLMEVAPSALLDGTMTLVISHLLARLARETIDGMVRACALPGSNQTSIVPIEIYTRENLLRPRPRRQCMAHKASRMDAALRSKAINRQTSNFPGVLPE
jgi:hypothetical protein